MTGSSATAVIAVSRRRSKRPKRRRSGLGPSGLLVRSAIATGGLLARSAARGASAGTGAGESRSLTGT